MILPTQPLNIFLEREPPNGSRAHPNYPLRQAVLHLQCGLTIGAPSFFEGTFRVGKYPLRPCELVVGVPGPDFVHVENIQVGNVQCLVSPIDGLDCHACTYISEHASPTKSAPGDVYFVEVLMKSMDDLYVLRRVEILTTSPLLLACNEVTAAEADREIREHT